LSGMAIVERLDVHRVSLIEGKLSDAARWNGADRREYLIARDLILKISSAGVLHIEMGQSFANSQVPDNWLLQNSGACQGSCRPIRAVSAPFTSTKTCSPATSLRSGFSVTTFSGVQFLVAPALDSDQQRWPRSRRALWLGPDQAGTVVLSTLASRRAARQAQGRAGRAGTQRGGEFMHGGDHSKPPLAPIELPSKAASFFWTSITSSALSRRLCKLSRSLVSCAMCRVWAR
jgi:hypothetical protein